MIRIRAAGAGDLDAIGAIQGRSSWKPADYLRFDCRVAEQDGRVVAFVASRETAPGEREVLFIAADPAFRRRGIAKALLLDEFARHHGDWFLEVRESNVAAIGLYESLGFRAIGRRQNYYSDPCESAIVMRFFS